MWRLNSSAERPALSPSARASASFGSVDARRRYASGSRRLGGFALPGSWHRYRWHRWHRLHRQRAAHELLRSASKCKSTESVWGCLSLCEVLGVYGAIAALMFFDVVRFFVTKKRVTKRCGRCGSEWDRSILWNIRARSRSCGRNCDGTRTSCSAPKGTSRGIHPEDCCNSSQCAKTSSWHA